MAGTNRALYDRRCRVTIANPVKDPGDFFHAATEGTEVIEIDGGGSDSGVVGMHVKFKIKKTLKKEPNTSEIIISNLSPTRRSSLQQKGVKVSLEAGYKETGLTRYFSGDVRTTDHVRAGADWDTTMKLGDGERAWRFARVAESFSPGTRAADVLKTIAKAMGLGMGNVAKKADELTEVFDQGYTASGPAAVALAKLVRSLRKTISIQDGELQILDPYETLDLPIPVISVETGLIGSPEMGTPPTKGKPALVKFKCLLTPTKPGAKVKLKSERYDGFIRIVEVTFDGDTAGGPFYSEMAGTIIR